MAMTADAKMVCAKSTKECARMARKAGYLAEGEGDSKGGTSSKGDRKGGYLAEREPGSKGDSNGDGKAGFPSPRVGQHRLRQRSLRQIPLRLEGKGDTAGYVNDYTAGYGNGYTAGYTAGYANGYKFLAGKGGTKL